MAVTVLRRSARVPSVPAILGQFVVVPAGAGVVGSVQRVQTWDGSDYAEYPANGHPRPVQVQRPFLLGQDPITVELLRSGGEGIYNPFSIVKVFSD